MKDFSQFMIIDGDFESADKESKKICESILGIEFKDKINRQICSDVIYVDSKSKKSIGISEIRRIQKEILLKPVEAKFKVYIFKNSQELTEQAQNSLLKILEDPPKHVVFIFLCTNHNRIIPTLISRSSLIHVNNKDEFLNKTDLDKLINAVENNDKFTILTLTDMLY